MLEEIKSIKTDAASKVDGKKKSKKSKKAKKWEYRFDLCISNAFDTRLVGRPA